MKVTRPKANPGPDAPIEIDAFAQDGMIVLKLGEHDLELDPTQAEELIELIEAAAADVEADEDLEEEDEEEEAEI